MKYYIYGLKNIFNIKGRASRKEFIIFNLVNSIMMILIGALLGVMNSILHHNSINFNGEKALKFVFIFYLLSGITIYIRRLHDLNRKGWWYLINIIPYINIAGLIYVLIGRGTKGKNKYGDLN